MVWFKKEKEYHMNNRMFITFFISIHIIFIFLQIHKQSYGIELSYQKQKHEKMRQELIEKKNSLIQELNIAQHRSTIKGYAQNTLKMKEISLSQIKQLPDEYCI
jgi:hypothetical protein